MNDSAARSGLARFLTPVDTAELLNVSLDEVFEIIGSQELPAIRVGHSWRIERTQLESYITGKYEETRRMALWRQAEFADVAELFDYQRNRTSSS